MKRFTVFMFIFIIIMFGLLVLQIFLSRAKNKFLGLIIPAVTLIYSFIATFGNMIYDGKNTLSIIVVFIVFNIPTFILLAVYGATKSGMKKAEQAEKEKVMEAALKNAAEAPLCIMKTIVDTMEMIRVLGEKGSRLAVSDAGVAILFAQAALEGASLNIFINTKMMKDQEEAERLNYLADQLIATGKELKETTYDAVLKGIRP